MSNRIQEELKGKFPEELAKNKKDNWDGSECFGHCKKCTDYYDVYGYGCESLAAADGHTIDGLVPTSQCKCSCHKNPPVCLHKRIGFSSIPAGSSVCDGELLQCRLCLKFFNKEEYFSLGKEYKEIWKEELNSNKERDIAHTKNVERSVELKKEITKRIMMLKEFGTEHFEEIIEIMEKLKNKNYR